MLDSTANIKKPLEGIRVLDLAHVLAGPYCTMFLSLSGAEVIKIEPPQGEFFRRHNLFSTDGREVSDEFVFLHRDKKGVTLNLRTPEGKEIFKRLVATADVLVENFTPRTMRSLGLGYDVLREINPRLIYTSISGYGHDDIYQSPYVDRPAFNTVAQGFGGLMDYTGDPGGPPLASGVSLGDLIPAIFALSGTLLALRMRDKTGVGQHVDIAMADCIASFSQIAVLEAFLTGIVPSRHTPKYGNPKGAFKAKDGYVVMTTMGDAMWERMCRLMERPDLIDDPRFLNDKDRGDLNDQIIKPALEEWAKDKTRQEVVDAFCAADLPAGPVQSAADLATCPHMLARNMIMDFDDPKVGPLRLTGNPIKMSGVKEGHHDSAPLLGEHTEQVLRGLLGLSDRDIAALKDAKAI